MRRLLPFAALASLCFPGLYAQDSTAQLDCNQPVDVQLTKEKPKANVRFNGSSGELVYIRIVSPTADAGFALTVPVVNDPGGNGLNPRTNSASATGATPSDLAGLNGSQAFRGYEFDLNTDGIFTLVLTSANGNAPGASLHIVLTRINRTCGTNTTLTCGRSLGGAISTTSFAQVDTYQYSVTAGDIVSFRVQRVSNAGLPDNNTFFMFAVYAADPTQSNRPFAVNVDATTKRLTSVQVLGRYDWTATITGTVTVVVFEYTGGLGGRYYISATKLSGGGCGGASLSCNSTVEGVITVPLTFGFYQISVNGGDVYQFRAARTDTSGAFAPQAEIFDSRGTSIAVISGAIASGHAVVTANITFPTSGTYTVLVSGPSAGGFGGYTLSTLRLNRPCDGAQALSCSSVVDGAINGLVRSQTYSLAASAKDAYLVRLLRPDANTLFRPRLDIYDQFGASVQFLNTTDLARGTFTVPADGSYSLVVTDSYDGAQSGNYTFSLLRLNRPCNTGTLGCGSPAAGSLPRALSSSVYTYTAAAGESFSVRMLPGSGEPQTAIEVYDALGAPIGQPLSGNFAGVDVVKPAAGTYTVVASDSSKTPAASSFTLDLVRTVNACSIPAAQGVTVNGVVSATSPFLAYRVAAASGDLISLRSSASTPGFAAQLELYDPDGARLDSGVFSLSRKAAVAGTYTVILGAATPRTAGGYSFAWQLLNHPAGTSPLACGTSAAGTLGPSSQFRYYTITANPGDVLRLLFTRISDNFSPQMEIFDPAGVRVSTGFDVTQKSAAGGNYLVVAGPATSNTETGNYSIAFQRPNNPCSPAALTCGQSTLRQVNLPGQLDTLSFNATGGDQTTIRLATRTGNYSPFAELYGSAGDLLTSSSNGIIRRVLPTDGAYTLLVRDRSGLNLGSYRVSLDDDTNTCPVSDTEAPVLTLTRPTGGEVLAGGTTFRIQWQSDDNVAVAAHTIALSTDGGKTFAEPFASLSGSAQVYDWILPTDVAPNRSAVIRVTATDGAGNAQSAASGLLTLIGSGFTPNSSATYTYDGFNRITEVSLSDGITIKYTWDASGNLAVITVTTQ